MTDFKEIMEYFGNVANIAAVIGIIYGLYQYLTNQRKFKEEEIRKNTPITIRLVEKGGARKITLPNKVRRGDLTRAEVLGRLGMIPMLPDLDNPKNKQQRFEIKKNATEEFIRDIDHLNVSSKGDTLMINCETLEMNQFDTKEIKKLGFDVTDFDNKNP